jgi:hypothetical protein
LLLVVNVTEGVTDVIARGASTVSLEDALREANSKGPTKKDTICATGSAERDVYSSRKTNEEFNGKQVAPDRLEPTAGLEQESNTDTGDNVSRVVPSPTCPFEFAPQHSNFPSTDTTHVFLSPHASDSAFEGRGTAEMETSADSARDAK